MSFRGYDFCSRLNKYFIKEENFDIENFSNQYNICKKIKKWSLKLVRKNSETQNIHLVKNYFKLFMFMVDKKHIR